MDMEITYKPIGTIYTPFDNIHGMPIQPTSNTSERGTIIIDQPYADGLKDLDGFSHIYLLYHFHKVGQSKLQVTPFLDNSPRGIFATRAPSRPNPIGLSLVRLVRIEGNALHVDGVDILNGTPILDIKPFVPEFESIQDVRVGWLEQSRGRVKGQRSDNRFE